MYVRYLFVGAGASAARRSTAGKIRQGSDVLAAIKIVGATATSESVGIEGERSLISSDRCRSNPEVETLSVPPQLSDASCGGRAGQADELR